MLEQNLETKKAASIISIEDLKKLKKLKKEEESLIKYYSALDFGTLLSETNDIIKKIKGHTLRADLMNQSKLLLIEFKSRLDSAPNEWTEHICQMRNEISKRLEDLNKKQNIEWP